MEENINFINKIMRMAVLAIILIGCRTQTKDADKTLQQIESTQSKIVVSGSVNDTLWIDLDNTQISWIGRKVTGQHSGTLNLSDGWVIMEDDILKSGQLIFDMHSIKNTDIESPEWKLKLEEHLKDADFFAVDSFPQAILTISGCQAIFKQNSTNTLKVLADLTIRDITHEISFPISLQRSGQFFSVEGTVDIARTLYNIQYKSGQFFADLGDRMIYDIFSVQFIVQTKPILKK